MVFYGPWVQPPDTDGEAVAREANRQSVRTSSAPGSYPAFPPAGSTPSTLGSTAGWDLSNSTDGFGHLAGWRLAFTEWILVIDVQWQIDNLPWVVMPPVSPTPTDPHVVGVDYEHPAGAALGPVTIRIPDLAVLSGHIFPDVHSTAPAAQAPDDAAMELHKLTATDYTWDRTGPPTPTLASWFTGPDIAAAPLVASVPANPGATLVPDFLGPPTDTWFGSSLAGEPGNTIGTVDIATTLAALDGGDYAVIAAIDRFVTESAPALPPYLSSGGAVKIVQQIVGWDFALGGASIGMTTVTALIHYRPPRYRYVYDMPPPQRQFPRDDGLGISTRRSWPPPTSKQYGQRRGPTATYQ